MPFLKKFELSNNKKLQGKLFLQHFLKTMMLELQIEELILSHNQFAESACNSLIKHLIMAPIDKLIQ